MIPLLSTFSISSPLNTQTQWVASDLATSPCLERVIKSANGRVESWIEIVRLRAERRKNDGCEDGCEFGWCIEVYTYWSVHHYHSADSTHSAHHHLTFLTSSNLTLPSWSPVGKRSSIPTCHNQIIYHQLTWCLKKALDPAEVVVMLYCALRECEREF